MTYKVTQNSWTEMLLRLKNYLYFLAFSKIDQILGVEVLAYLYIFFVEFYVTDCNFP